jgi:predicted nuclease with TOPRIM domain
MRVYVALPFTADGKKYDANKEYELPQEIVNRALAKNPNMLVVLSGAAKEVQELKEQLEDLAKVKDVLMQQLSDTEAELAKANEEKAQIEAELTKANEDLAKAKKEITKLKKSGEE